MIPAIIGFLAVLTVVLTILIVGLTAAVIAWDWVMAAMVRRFDRRRRTCMQMHPSYRGSVL